MSQDVPGRLRRREVVLLAGAGMLAAGSAVGQEELLGRLRGGSLVLLLRHAHTEPGTGDPPNFRHGDCSTQRNLDEAGRAQARAIGARLREAGVPVGRVLSSRWCRCRVTAELLGLGPVEHLPALDSFFADPGRKDEHRAGMLAFIAGWNGPGNAVLVTHQVNITAATGIFPRPGETIVLTPAAEILGRLPPPM